MTDEEYGREVYVNTARAAIADNERDGHHLGSIAWWWMRHCKMAIEALDAARQRVAELVEQYNAQAEILMDHQELIKELQQHNADLRRVGHSLNRWVILAYDDGHSAYEHVNDWQRLTQQGGKVEN